MPPEKEFGTPNVNVHKRTTKVNIAVVVGVFLFLLVGVAAVAWFSQRG